MLSNRVKKAKKVDVKKGFHKILKDKNGHKNGRRQFTACRGSDPTTNYQQIIESHIYNLALDETVLKAAQYQCQCQKVTGTGMVDCLGNSNHTVCYHNIAALYQLALDEGKRLSFTESLISAISLMNLNKGSKLVKITSTQGKGVLWAVVSRDLKNG